MGVIAKYVKSILERKRYWINYSNWLDTGETVSTVVFSVDKPTTPPLVVDGVQNTADGLSVQYYVSGGVDGVDYVVSALLTTSQGQVKLDEVFVSVREPA